MSLIAFYPQKINKQQEKPNKKNRAIKGFQGRENKLMIWPY